MESTSSTSEKTSDILDIGGSQQSERIHQTLQKKLFAVDSYGRKFLPDILFSDDRGLELWRDINSGQSYYQTDDEVELLNSHGAAIAAQLPSGCHIVDLGCGDVRKVTPLLQCLEQQGKSVSYYGLDLSKSSVENGIAYLKKKSPGTQSVGLWGTFEDGMEWSKTLPGPRIFLSLGSIFGNDRFERAVRYLDPWAAVLREDDRILLGIDGCQDEATVWRSYHDQKGLFERFIRNGFEASNRVLGSEWYKHDEWTVSGILESPPVEHRFKLTARADVHASELGIVFKKGSSIECYEAFKYGPDIMREQFSLTGLEETGSWTSASGRISQYMLRRSTSRH